MKNLKIKDVVEREVPSGDENTSLTEALKMMISKKTNVFIVLDSQKKILGIFTLYDILDKIIPFFIKLDTTLGYISTNELINKQKIKKISNLKVKDIMVKKVYSLYEDEEIIKAIILMYVKNFDYIPVLNKKNEFKGIVNRVNIEKIITKIINSYTKQN